MALDKQIVPIHKVILRMHILRFSL